MVIDLADAPRVAGDSVPAYALEQLRYVIAEATRERGGYLRAHATLITESEQMAQEGLNQGETVYEMTNANRKGDREKRAHFVSVAAWFGRYSSALAARVQASDSRIDDLDRYLKAWAEEVEHVLVAPRTDLDTFRGLLDGPGDYISRLPVLDDSRFPALQTPVPDRPPLGSNLGPFRFISRWLLQTESMELTLITGMLGFGLLGAAASTFVREQAGRRRRPKQPLVRDLAGVVIRGGSAAIVVFLAVMGGLAIVTAEPAEPNPYVLLFTCLVGAVFSERIWKWAEKTLGRSFADEPDDVRIVRDAHPEEDDDAEPVTVIVTPPTPTPAPDEPHGTDASRRDAEGTENG